MPYRSIREARGSGFPTTAEGLPMSLAQINHLARIYDAIKETGSAKYPFAVAWSSWKDIYEIEGDGWVKIEKMALAVESAIRFVV